MRHRSVYGFERITIILKVEIDVAIIQIMTGFQIPACRQLGLWYWKSLLKVSALPSFTSLVNGAMESNRSSPGSFSYPERRTTSLGQHHQCSLCVVCVLLTPLLTPEGTEQAMPVIKNSFSGGFAKWLIFSGHMRFCNGKSHMAEGSVCGSFTLLCTVQFESGRISQACFLPEFCIFLTIH